ncbi:hypothetical protein [Roseimaritima ulvae]|uniref:Uncharacterized protein n=1 Tax=Roseimaritima ulvae TaxID=980254 RepID=A0A5B9QK50_9BACT|nr:hypothetical protein [Roseimaritima ulvae]QEG39438.1 hypothetical protein UC8_14330 [Roseimaritima ulvae]
MRPTHCPVCEAALAADAVLCIECGYHLERGQRVRAETSATRRREALDANPYAPIADVEPIDDRKQYRLDDQSAQRAKAIADDAFAFSTTLLLVLLFMCPFWVLAVPYAAVRFAMWCHMRRRYPELRQPNSLSPYADIAVRFDEARNRYLFAIGFPALVAALVGLLVAANSR